MLEFAKYHKGFLGVESARGSNGFGITVSYWQSEKDIKAWKANGEHRLAQELGRNQWYNSFMIRVCKVERNYGLNSNVALSGRFALNLFFNVRSVARWNLRFSKYEWLSVFTIVLVSLFCLAFYFHLHIDVADKFPLPSSVSKWGLPAFIIGIAIVNAFRER